MTKKQNNKYLYEVTLYYHTNCHVIVESDTPLNLNEAINAALSKVGNEKYQEELHESLQCEDDADVETYNVEGFPFDKDGRLIEYYDHVMWYDEEQGSHFIGKVIYATADKVGVKTSWDGEYELRPSECIVVQA